MTRRWPTTSPPRFSPPSSDDLSDFVLDSCLDEQVCPSLIDTIRGTHDAETYLEQCLADGLFLTRG